MLSSNVLTVSPLLLASCLLLCTTGAIAGPTNKEQPAKAQLSDADKKAIHNLMKEQETAWNKHDMKAFTKSFRDDAEGINVVGMYWRGKAKILKHLTDYHNTYFKNLEEYLEEVQIHPLDKGNAIVVIIWKVGSFPSPGGGVVPASRHRSTQVLAKGKSGWQVVHFHNTTIDEMALKHAATQG